MKTITGFEDYKISEDGKIFAVKLNKYLKPFSNGLGYLAVKLRKNGQRKMQYIHRLVAQEYIASCVGLDINHKDGVKSNNTVSNLEVVTHKQNLKHAFDFGLLRGFVEKYHVPAT